MKTLVLPARERTWEVSRKEQVTLDVVLGPVRGAHFPAEVLVIGLHLADVGSRACGVRGAGDGGELDFIQVVVPVGPHVTRGTEQPERQRRAQ
jgi:hypothetical protein